MAATLLAFFALGFYAATLLTLFRFLALVIIAALVVSIIGLTQGLPILHGLGLGCGGFVLAQVGFGVGLAWVASTRSRTIPD